MSLKTQVELMTVPQEFTRLCNATLIAEHSDDFLPIDDDRGDRGNDGYLKSERRMFAAHCFKRVQNQQLGALIRAKMIGDLGKAIALKSAGAWPIDAWTFLSNYPIPEALAAEVSTIGRAGAIDVSWRGPDYFAATLARHPEVMSEFPGLQVNRTSEQLERIEAALVNDERPGHAARSSRGHASGSRTALVRDRPPCWEYLLYGAVLREGRDALEDKWRDHELRLPSRSRARLDRDDIADFLRRRVAHMFSLVSPIERVFAGQLEAFGAPGEHGNPIRIEHFANWIIRGYEDILDWEADMRAVDVPSEFDSVIDLTARLADEPLNQFRAFIDEFITWSEGIPAHLERPAEEQQRDPLVIEAMIVVSLDSDLVDESIRALERAFRHEADATE